MNYQEQIENDVLVVAVVDAKDSYFMWQRGLTEDVGSEDGIYFEFDDQINGGHEIMKECTIDLDGMHVVLASGKMEHFYFPPKFDKYIELKKGLLKIYEGNEHVLEFHDI
jgi:hypothetical protein